MAYGVLGNDSKSKRQVIAVMNNACDFLWLGVHACIANNSREKLSSFLWRQYVQNNPRCPVEGYKPRQKASAGDQYQASW